jgi:hypothetical protein
MIDCTTCSPALPIPSCVSTLAIGVVDLAITQVVVRFTDQATGRAVIADVDVDQLPAVVVTDPPVFAPGHAVVIEVLSALDDGPIAPVEFLPYVMAIDGTAEATAYPVTCIVFTPIKTFTADGSVYPAAPRTLIIES